VRNALTALRRTIRAIRAWTSTASGATTRPTSRPPNPKVRLAKKGAGKEAKLCYSESVLMENRNGLMVALRVDRATGRAECEQGLAMLEGVGELHRITVAADKGYDQAEFVAGCRALHLTPHVARNERRPGGSAL
jgi:hypothetical protein